MEMPVRPPPAKVKNVEALVGLCKQATKLFASCADSWNDEELDWIRQRLPIDDRSINLTHLKIQCINIRKNPKNNPLKRSRNTPEWLAKYRLTNEYRDMRTVVMERDGWRCRVDNRPATEIHHRHYGRCGKPGEADDCIAVCKKCHLFCDKRRESRTDEPPDTMF